ncbi:MAG: glycosyltransferase family 1 protein [Pseudomonadota bacterium]
MAGARTGIGRYAMELAQRALQSDDIGDVAAFNQGLPVPLPRGEGQAAGPTQQLRARLSRVPAAVIGAHALARAWSPWTLRRYAQYVYHETNYVAFPHRGPLVLTVHDLSYLRFPEFHPSARVNFFQRYFPPSLRRADQIITDSQFIAEELISEFSLAPDKVRVVPLGITVPNQEPQFQRHPECILCVGSMDPRKNLARFFRAYERLPESLRQRYPIRHVGPAGWPDEQLEKSVSRLQRLGHLTLLGFVDDQRLDQLYRSAALFVYPSLYEGFGLPLLEAMIRRVPVAAASTSSIPEVLGDGEFLFPPLDESAMAVVLDRALGDAGLRQQEAERGYQRALRFSWEQTFAQTLTAYRDAAQAFT